MTLISIIQNPDKNFSPIPLSRFADDDDDLPLYDCTAEMHRRSKPINMVMCACQDSNQITPAVKNVHSADGRLPRCLSHVSHRSVDEAPKQRCLPLIIIIIMGIVIDRRSVGILLPDLCFFRCIADAGARV